MSTISQVPETQAQSQPVNPHWRRNFLTILSGQTVSLIGTAAVQFSLIWWLASETDSPMVMSLAGLLVFIPQLILGPFVGVWVDRLPRKAIIIASDLFTALIALIMAVFFITSTPPYWLICVMLGLRAISNVFQTPAMQAAVPMLVPQDQLVRANGWGQFLQSGAFMLGPVIGAALFAAFSMPVILFTDVFGALVACAAIAFIKVPDPPHINGEEERERKHFFGEMKEGALVFLKDRRLTIITAGAMLAMVFMMPLSTYYPLMTSTYFDLSAWYGSVVEITFALGMMVSAGILSSIGKIKNKFFWTLVGLGLFALTSFFSGILPSTLPAFWIFAALCACMGASMNLYNIPYIAYMQETIPPDAMGRAFSLVGSLMSLSMPVGLLFSGPIAEAKGVPFWFAVCGAIATAITLITGLILFILRRKYPPMPPIVRGEEALAVKEQHG